MRAIMLLLAFVLLASVECQSTDSHPSQNSTISRDQSNAIAQALGSTSSSISSHDYEAIVNYSKATHSWNIAVAPLIRDYLDPNVSADAWVSDARPIIAEVRKIYASMFATVVSIQDTGLRKIIMQVVTNYKAKLDAMTALHLAVAAGDAEAAQSASNALSQAASEGSVLALSLMDRIRPYVDPDTLQAVAKRKGHELSEYMKPRSR